MYDLNHALDQLMSRLDQALPGVTLETRKTYRAVPAQAFEMLTTAVEAVFVAAAEQSKLKRVRLEDGFSSIGKASAG